MLQFVVKDGGRGDSQSWLCEDVPFTIGRAADADMQLVAPGVWERHAEVVREDNTGRLIIRPIGEALLLVNGERSEARRIVPGDEIQVGGVSIAVGLSAVEQTFLKRLEMPVWILIAVTLLFELLLLLELK